MNDVGAVMGPVAGGPVELEVSLDIVKRGLLITPVLIAVAALIWGGDGAWSCAFAVALVLINFLLSAALISYSARISRAMLMGATMFGYLFRLGLITVAVLLVKDTDWISLPALGATIIVTHLGLLIWELKYVALSLAYPGLKPARS